MRTSLLVLSLSVVWLVQPALADSAADVDAFARTPFFEGVPVGEAKALGPAGCPRLLELLADPPDPAQLGNVIEALGILGCDGAFDAVAAFASSAGVGEVDRATFRALRTCSSAMGHLAASDERALAWLLARAGGPGTPALPPAWHFRQHHGARLDADERRRAVSGLALSARPAAALRLQQLEDDPVVRDRAREGLSLLHAIRAGDSAVLDTQRGREVER